MSSEAAKRPSNMNLLHRYGRTNCIRMVQYLTVTVLEYRTPIKVYTIRRTVPYRTALGNIFYSSSIYSSL